jgi:hypothetical protein
MRYGMTEIRSEIAIAAPAGRVWDILTDFARFPEWNPFICKAKGRAQVGERLTVVLQPAGGGATTFRPRVLRADPGRELAWLGRLVMPGIFDGEHHFVIESQNGGVRFVQREVFTGVLVGLILSRIGDSTRQGFEAMNRALKARAEAQSE